MPLASELLKNRITFNIPWSKTCHYYFFQQLRETLADFNNFDTHIRNKLDVKVCSFGHLTLTLSLHYCVKCRNHSLAVDNNEFIPSRVCIGAEIINWTATNAIGNYYHSKSHTCHITSSLFQHVLKMSSCSTNASGRRWHHLPTVRSVTAWLKRPTRFWCIISVFQLTTLK